MANNYLQFSFEIDCNTKKEADWLFDKLKEANNNENTNWCCSVEKETNNILWVYAEDWGDIEQVAEAIKEYLSFFIKDIAISFTYSESCSKMRVDEFSGGGVVITKNKISYMHASSWVDSERRRLLE